MVLVAAMASNRPLRICEPSTRVREEPLKFSEMPPWLLNTIKREMGGRNFKEGLLHWKEKKEMIAPRDEWQKIEEVLSEEGYVGGTYPWTTMADMMEWWVYKKAELADPVLQAMKRRHREEVARRKAEEEEKRKEDEELAALLNQMKEQAEDEERKEGNFVSVLFIVVLLVLPS